MKTTNRGNCRLCESASRKASVNSIHDVSAMAQPRCVSHARNMNESNHWLGLVGITCISHTAELAVSADC